MAKRALPSVADDFASVLSFLQKRGIVPSTPAAALIENAKRIHLVTYSLILWRFRLKRLPHHGRVFVEEIASDALQILPQVLMGYGKTGKLLTRGIVENVLRHVYFSDHPVEFERMNREPKWYISVNDLFDYVRIHPILLRSEKIFDAANRLSTLHSELSAGIHGRQVRDLEMRVALNKIAYSDQAAKKEAALIERCATSANFLLAVFHRTQMAGFGQEDRRIILRTMPPKASMERVTIILGDSFLCRPFPCLYPRIRGASPACPKNSARHESEKDSHSALRGAVAASCLAILRR